MSGSIHELRAVSKDVLSDCELLDRMIVAAARSGRSTVLRYLAQQGVELKADRLLDIAATSGYRELFVLFHDRGANVISPELIEIVLRNDRSSILRFWLQKRLATPQELLPVAVRFNALYCFFVLVNQPTIRPAYENVAAFAAARPLRLAAIAQHQQGDLQMKSAITTKVSYSFKDKVFWAVSQCRRVIRRLTMRQPRQ